MTNDGIDLASANGKWGRMLRASQRTISADPGWPARGSRRKSGRLSSIFSIAVDMAAQISDNQLVLTFTMAESNGRFAGLRSYRFDLVSQ